MKEVLFIYSWLPSEFLGTLSYPNHYRMTKFISICLANLPRQISKVFVHLEELWRKYLFISPNDMKFIQFLHMPKLSPSSKLQLSQIIYVSPGSIYILWPNWHVAKQVLYRPLLLPSNFSGTLPYPNHCHMIIFSSIFLVNLSREISKVSTSREALWSKY